MGLGVLLGWEGEALVGMFLGPGRGGELEQAKPACSWPLQEAAQAGWEHCRVGVPRQHLQTSFEKFLRSSLETPGWTPWGAEQPPALLLPTVQEAGTLKYEHLAFYYPI